MIPKKIIDNSDVKLSTFLNNVLKEIPHTKFDIATAFFNIQAYAFIKDNIQGVKRFRLLLGKTPEIRNETTLGEVLLKMIREEVEGFDLSQEKDSLVKEFIRFLNENNVEVKLYDKEFLHGKAYIFDQLIVVGSSNFTPSGLTHNTELNSVSLEAEAKYVREHWFDKFWSEAVDFKAELVRILEASRFGTREYTPYEVYIKSLYELQKDDIMFEDEEKKGQEESLPSSKVNLTEFQEDAVRRVFTRLKKYKACMVADSVGLGKTWIAKKIIEEFGFYKRKRFLIVCPAQLRNMWKDEVKDLLLSESILSQEDLATEDFLSKARQAIGSDMTEVSLIVVDESHNFRNPLSNRWENFFTLVADHITKGGERPYILFLTATPINNTIWDLYWQIMLLTINDQKTFMKEGILDLFKFFKDVDREEDPNLLNDLMNEISIRRTRDYIKQNYPDAEVNGQRIIFPERVLKNIDYQLDKAYQGLYRDISRMITEQLTMAYYRMLEYRKTEKLSKDEEMVLGRMVALEGIFRTILLKRLESSVEAFRKSVSNHINFLEKFKEYLKKGKFLTKRTFYKYVSNLDEETAEDFIDELEEKNLEDYRKEDLFRDIERDISLFKEMGKKVEAIDAEADAKLKELKKRLLELSSKGQVVIFTYYADTLDYIYEKISEDALFSKISIEKISGRITSASRRTEIVNDFMNGKINILMSTDVLSEGMNLQKARYLINYDLHWNPTRMIQRAGRIDRIGSPFREIFVYNFFPEEELEDLLRLVEVLQNKIRNIDNAVGLDVTVLGEEVNPKVFGIIRRIREQDTTVFDELEKEVFGGGEKFYQPLKDYLKARAIQELKSVPLGICSGLKKGMKGLFLYYKYGDDFHFWFFYDLIKGEKITNKTKILDYISCPPEEVREIPDFFEKVYDLNSETIKEIEAIYKEVEQRERVDSAFSELNFDKSKKFVSTLIREIDLRLDEYLLDFVEDKKIEEEWEGAKGKLLTISLTKKRLQKLRTTWRNYKNNHKGWKRLLGEISEFLEGKLSMEREEVPPYNPELLKLITIDFVS
ncbi:MAG: helicase-related protein [Candidatus Loosdrechtia sp.]|uniref:helicase-related protein n=1 Tax=Candidatus Loosdrechtia sp. TaxID=3101272 RepID=UPI003A745DBD|nr:MAG: helicase-related protein [Candidatus Jettenia sp. AMX2]